MVKKFLVSIIIFLIVILGLFYQYHKEEMILNTALLDSKSSTYLYALEQNKTQVLKSLLVSDIIFLINGYDRNIYESSSNIKRTLCQDVPKYHIETIERAYERLFV